ncbi:MULTISPECIES: hypothetical protein [Streptomyces]|uniref:hypothetical protein n=1 Tax=Streptomyces TaxID=1883 RepID=UPI00340307F3
MFQETPVYDGLVVERGDVPAMVRGQADRLHRQWAQLLCLAPAARPRPAPTDAPGPQGTLAVL